MEGEVLELAERCEQASEGSLKLNKAILSALGYTWRGMAYWSRDDTHIWPGGTRLTESVDAALTLVPDGWIVAQLGQSGSKGWWAELRQGYRTSYNGVATSRQFENATPALALCAAALRARHAP